MAVNRFVLNAISYHGKGAIKEIPGIVSQKGFKKAFIAFLISFMHPAALMRISGFEIVLMAARRLRLA